MSKYDPSAHSAVLVHVPVLVFVHILVHVPVSDEPRRPLLAIRILLVPVGVGAGIRIGIQIPVTYGT